nr:RNA-directed DNA polymerase, eukaryota, reverse transcriptase zinc-binding domain protein [Tanacetum cinerariifolium]
MRKEGCATWDGGNSTWGGRVRVFGTVLVCVRVQERAGGEGRVLAGRVVKGTVGLIWVKINGFPLCAWGSNAFKKVVSGYGKFMFFECDQTSDMSTGRICISMKQKHYLSEEVQVVISEETCTVQVHELGTWSINIEDDQASISSSESGCKDKDNLVDDSVEVASEEKDNSITELKNQLEESLKEKDDLKLKLEKFETSSKNLTNLINSQISPKDKTGLGYDGQLNERNLNNIHMNKSDVFERASDSSVNESEEDNNQVNDRYKAGEGYHAVPPPYTGNFRPPRPNLSFAWLDDSVFKSTLSETVISVHETETSASKTSKESMEKPKTVRSSASLTEEWESDSDDDCVIRPLIEQNKPSYAKINFVKLDENTRKSVIKQHTYRQAENLRKTQNSRIDKRNWNGMITQKLGDGFKKICVKNEGKATGQREVRLVKNNAQRVNHQNFSNNLTRLHPKRNFVPTAVATKSGQVPVNTTKQSSPKAATSISTVRPINTAVHKPKMNDALPTNYSYFQTHSSIKRPINKRTVVTDINFNKKISTVKVNNVTTARPKAVVSTAKGKRENAVKSSTCWIWRPTENVIDHISKDSGSCMHKRFNYADLQGRLKKAKRTTKTSQSSRPIHLVADETVYKEWKEKMERAATTASSLEAEEEIGNINRTQSMTTLNEPLPQETGSSSGHMCQVTILGGAEDTREVQITATIDKKVKLVSEASIRRHLKLEDYDGFSTLPNTETFEQLALMGASKGYTRVDIPLFLTMLVQGPILQGERSTVPIKSHHTPSGAQTTSQPPLLSPFKIPTRQETEVPQLSSPTHTNVADEAASIEVQWRHEQEIKFETEDISTAETLVYIRRSASKDKGKCILIDFEPEQTTTKLQQRQERAGYEAAVRLQEQLDEEERQRIARVREEASSYNVEEWEDIQAKNEADKELILRIQVKEREKYSKAEKARLLAQQRTYMSNYVKHIGSHTLQQLKRLSFDELKNLFEATIKSVKTFTLIESDVDRTIPKIADESLKRVAEEELEQESSKRQKTGESSEPREKEDDELTQEDLKEMVMIVLVEEVYVEDLHERFSTIEPTDDKEKELWVELKRLFELDNDDTLWKLQNSTWINKAGTKMSKLDRLLVSENVLDTYLDIKFFHSWIQRLDLDVTIKETWAELLYQNVSTRSQFHTKVKELKKKIKVWHANVKQSKSTRQQEVLTLLKSLEEKIDLGRPSNEDREEQIKLLQECDDLEKMAAMDMVQKARIRWDVEGDEIQFFH